MIGSLIQPDLEQLVRDKQWDALREVLAGMDDPDVAELMIDLPPEDEGVMFRLLPRDRAAAVFSCLPLDRQQEAVQSLSNAQVHTILAAMTPDDRTRLLEELPAEVTRRLLETLSPDELKLARRLLGYPEGTAGRYMTPKYVSLSSDMTAQDAIDHVRQTGRGKETLNILYVTETSTGKLLEDVRLGSLVLAEPGTKVGDVDDRPLVTVPATASGADVVSAFEKYGRTALPVVDGQGHMLGIITVDDVLEYVEKRATQAIHKLGGSEALDAPYREVGFWPMLRKRGGWLAALFLGETLTATAMGHFEHEIQRAAVVALFVPLIISSGGNSGSQATSIIIRSLALQELRLRDWFYVVRKELMTSVALGFFLGAVGFLRIVMWYGLGWQHYDGHPYLIGLTVWASLTGVVTFGSIVGAMLPFILRRLGFDPATASAPFVATLVDVTGLVIYFTVALLVLRGTLL